MSHVDISFVLSHGSGQAGESTQPVTLHLAVIVSTNKTSPSDSPQIPAQGDDTPAEEVPNPTIGQDSRGPEQFTALRPPPEHTPIQSSTPVPQDQAELSFAEKAQIGLDRADKAEESIDGSNTWQGVVERVKLVMDALSPVAGVRVINIPFCLSSAETTCSLSSTRSHRWRMGCFW